MSEVTLYSQDSVEVTTSRVQIGHITYAVRNITSVKTIKTPPKRGVWYLLMIIGISVYSFQTVIGVAIIIAAIIGMVLAKPKYRLILATSGNEVDALSSKDESIITSVLKAVQNAIIEYR